jgi:hypothetical protein
MESGLSVISCNGGLARFQLTLIPRTTRKIGQYINGYFWAGGVAQARMRPSVQIPVLPK